MSDLERNAIIAFEALFERIGHKQDRVIFFYADPDKTRPV